MANPKRILIIRRKGIGDMLLAMPLVVALRDVWPDTKIFMVADGYVHDAIEGSPYLEQVVVYDEKELTSGSLARQLSKAVRWVRMLRALECDLVLDLHGTPQTATWTRATGAPTRLGRPRRFRTWAYTIVVPDPPPGFGGKGLHFLEALGIESPPWKPAPGGPLEHDNADVDRTLAALFPNDRPLVLINPGGGWPSKLWPPDKFAALARLIAGADLANVAVAWAPGEEAMRDRVVDLAEGHASALPATDLTTLAAYLKAADLVVSNDTGPKHMAAGEGTPTLTIFGPSDPEVWEAPIEQNRWISNPVPCSPCNEVHCVVPGHPCLTGLSAELVMAEVIEMLDRRG